MTHPRPRPTAPGPTTPGPAGVAAGASRVRRTGPTPRSRLVRRGRDAGGEPGAARASLLPIARRLTDRDRWIIRMLQEHRVLTSTQLAALAFPTLRVAQHRLRELHQLGVTDRFQPFAETGSRPLHHLLGPVGAAVLAAEEGLTLDQLGYRRDQILATAHHLALTHLVAVNTVFTHLATTPPPPHIGLADVGSGGEVVLEVWWSERRCARLYGHHIRPDGYARLRLTAPPNSPTDWPIAHPRTAWPRAAAPARPAAGSSRWMEFFLEYDRGSERLAQLTAKLTGYHHLAVSTGIATPVLILLTRPGREPHARDALARAHAHLTHPARVPVATAVDPTHRRSDRTTTTSTLGRGASARSAAAEQDAAHTAQLLRADTGVTDAIWLPLHPDQHYTAGGGRRSMGDLAALWPAPGPDQHADELGPALRAASSARPGPRPGAHRTSAAVQLPAPPPRPPRPESVRGTA